MARTRQPSCKLSAQQADKIFPAEEQPLPECVLCHLARSDGKTFYCGMVERMKGRYINRPSVTDREVKLQRGVIVDGNSIPAGTVLKLVSGKASDRIWCRRLQGRATPKPFLVAKDAIDFGNSLVEVEFYGALRNVFAHAIQISNLQIGKVLLPRRGDGVGVDISLLIDGEWVAEEDAAGYTGRVVTRLRMPLWLAREKGLRLIVDKA